MALNQEDLSKFREQRERLGGMLSDASEVIQELNMTSAGDNLSKLGKKVYDDTFKIQVIGTFKNGKSTFINSLLGEAVLPAYALPCTAVINEVKYGPEKKAVLYFRNPLPEKLPASISDKALQHMKEHNMQEIPPLEIPYTEIEEYVTIPMGMDATEMLLESPYEKVELFWPLPLLEQGVEIIDSPGLNEAETRTRVTMDYLSKADAILFVLNATALCGMAEMDFIENTLNASGFNDIFFVVNRFDCIPDKEKDKLKQFAHLKVDEYTTNDIYFVSAQQALDGELGQDTELYKESGMSAFTTRLTEFLTKDKGRIKLSQPARELKRILNNEALYKVIPSQRAMLDSSLTDLTTRYETAKPQLEMLKNKKEQVVTKINLKIEQSKHEFIRVVRQNAVKITESISGWIASYKPKKEIGGFFAPNKKDIDAVVLEIASFVQTKVEEQQNAWKKDVLLPLAQERSNYIFDSVEADLSNLLKEIDSIRVHISGNSSGNVVDNIPVWERIGGAVAGFLGGGLGAAMTGGVTGLSKELVKSVAVNIGGAVLLGVLGLFNPFTAVALIAATVFAGLIGKGEKTMNTVKAKTSDIIIDQFSSRADEETEEIVNTIIEQLNEVTNGISKALDVEIKQVSLEVETIMSDMKKGQANVDERKKVITSCETRIKNLSNNLDALTFELIEQK